MIRRAWLLSSLYVLLALGVLFGASSGRVFAQNHYGASLPYDFSSPDAVIDLPRELNEISGLGLVDSLHLVAVQDERAYLYVLRMDDGSIDQKIDFGRSGDYEAVEAVGTRILVLRSDGDLFILEDWQTDNLRRARVRTRLSSRYDAEGLAFNDNGDLFLASEAAGGRAALIRFNFEAD